MDFKTISCGCPSIKDQDWDLAEREADDTIFFSQPICMFFHIPVNKGRALKKLNEAIQRYGLVTTKPKLEILKDGLFRGALLVAVNKRVPEAEKKLTKWQGNNLITKVVKGNRRETAAAVSGLLSYIRSKTGEHPNGVYFWRVDCETCGEVGLSRTVIIAAL